MAKTKLKKYVFHGAGLALGSTIIVLATEDEVALAIARRRQSDAGLGTDSLRLDHVVTNINLSGDDQVIFFDSGDY